MSKGPFIAEPIAKELKKFEELFASSVRSEDARIEEIISYMMKSDGKKIRPMLLLLAAKSSGEINDVTYNAAITLELLHTASLIHDDVVDESKMRRGKASLNAVYDNKAAVLTGDYYLSSALMKSVLTGNIDIISEVSNLGRRLAEGELDQLYLVKEIIVDEAEYLEVISKKTASLISVSMKVGAISTGGSVSEVERFAQLGETIGVIFQMRDDIFDYYTNAVGKPTGNDIREGKITLPLLHALDVATKEEKDFYMKIITEANYSNENIDKLIQFAINKGGIEYTYNKMDQYKEKAVEIISTIEKEDIKEALHSILNYIIERRF